MKLISFKRVTALALAVLLLPAPVKAAQTPDALTETVQNGNVQTYYVADDTAHNIYWTQGLTPPKMSADGQKLGSDGYFHQLVSKEGGPVTYQAPYSPDQGYFDLNGNGEQEEGKPELGAAANVLYWWLAQNSEYVEAYLEMLRDGQLQQPEGLKPLAPYNRQMWDRILAAPDRNQGLAESVLSIYLTAEERYPADMAWDYFLNGFYALAEGPNTADGFTGDSTGGYFHPIFGAVPLSLRIDGGTEEAYTGQLKELLNSGHGLTLTCGAGEELQVLTLWGAEYDENDKLVRMFVTDAADGDQKIGGEPRGLYSLEVKENKALLAESGEELPILSVSALSLGQKRWEEKLEETHAPDAAAPVITAQPQGAEYTVGTSAADLSVSAEVSDGGTLSYQWYRADDLTSEGEAIEDAADSTLAISADTVGETYYYCVVTNTLEGKNVSVTSDRVLITVSKKPVVVAAPEITSHPKSGEYTVGDTAEALSVTATGSEGTVLSYQWYISDSDTADGKPVENATKSSLSIGTQQAGTAWFYCVVTASNPDDESRTASAESARARILVNEKKIMAQKPELKAQPQSADYLVGQDTEKLTVKAEISDGGSLSYQWYAADSGSDQGKPIENANKKTLKPSSEKAGTRYYYCVVTNTSAEDDKITASVTTSKAKITVKEKSSLAKEPEIKTQPVNATYTLHDGVRELTVKAVSPDHGSLSYQWYRSGSASGQGSAIQGATGTACKPSTDQIGISYYYCVVTNTKGKETAVKETERAKITVAAPTSAKAPQISAQPKDAAYIVNDTPADMSVSATSLDGGKLSYQWYASESETGKGTAIAKATGSSYQPSTEKTGVTWYYCVVTNTNAADRDLTATATTNRARITVKEAELLLVKRDLTKVDPNLEKAGFQSVTAIEKAMMKALPKRDTPYGAVYYDICLEQILADGSRVPASEFPENGLTFTLSYPKGTQKKGYDFVAVHMITTGSKAGTVELPKIRLTNDGIQMTLDSLSPVMIAWTETGSKPVEKPEPTKKPDTPSTGDSTPVGLLVAVVLVSGAALGVTAYFVLRKKKDDR